MKRSAPLKRKPRKRKPPGSCQIAACRQKSVAVIEEKRRCATHASDKLVGDWVKLRDSECVRCHATDKRLDWAHVISRRYRSIRWEPTNSVAFCRPCHFWQGNNPLEGEQFFRSIGIDYDSLAKRALNDPPMDPNEVFAEWWSR